jgi:hypothetical protein
MLGKALVQRGLSVRQITIRCNLLSCETELLVVTIETTKAGAITIKVGDTPVPLTQLAGNVRMIMTSRTGMTAKILAPATI